MGKPVLISIHPEHVANILCGKKVFEYRKKIPKHNVSYLVLYCTAPIMKIVAVVEVLGCIIGSPTRVWNETSFGSGISRRFFREYFSGQQSASAFSLGKVYKIAEPISLSCLPLNRFPPQSFCYLNDADMRLISKKQSYISSIAPTLIFVGGIHGVGKSTICQKALGPAGYKCVTASSLIRAHGKEIDLHKHVDDVGNNQKVLLQQLTITKSKYCRLLLDGHFTLINSHGDIEPVDVEVFRAMKPDKLILIKGSPSEIAIRLKERDGREWSVSFLTKFQKEEEKHALGIANSIGIPLQIINNDIGYASLAKLISGS